jgi:hypothetical protein
VRRQFKLDSWKKSLTAPGSGPGGQSVKGPGDPLCVCLGRRGERVERSRSAPRRDGRVVRSLDCKFYSNRYTVYGGGGASVGPEPVGRRSRTRGSDRRGPFLDESPIDLRRCKLFAISVKTVRTVFPPRPAGRGGWAPGYPYIRIERCSSWKRNIEPAMHPGPFRAGGTDRPGRPWQETRWGRHPSETETADRLDFNI